MDGKFFIDVVVSSYDNYDLNYENDKTVIYGIHGNEFTRSGIYDVIEKTGYFKIDHERYIENYSERRERDGDLSILMSGWIIDHNKNKNEIHDDEINENNIGYSEEHVELEELEELEYSGDECENEIKGLNSDIITEVGVQN